MVTQLRIYTINRGEMEAFVKAWTDGVVPLRRKHGYTIEGAWILEKENKFVWIVTYSGPESWEAKEAAYYGSPERKAMRPDPAQHIALAESWFLRAALPA